MRANLLSKDSLSDGSVRMRLFNMKHVPLYNINSLLYIVKLTAPHAKHARYLQQR